MNKGNMMPKGNGGFANYVELGQRGPLHHGVVEALRELIIARVLAPGDHIVETDIAARLNVSRGPIREALQVLNSEGWVELRPRKGAFVHRPSAPEIYELFIVRGALESEAARLATGNMTTEIADELRQICAEGAAAVMASDDSGAVAANSRFHMMIAELAQVDLLLQYITAVNRRVRWVFKPLVRHRGMDSWNEHRAIVAALEEGAADKAARLMREHTDRTGGAFTPDGPGEAEGLGDADNGII